MKGLLWGAACIGLAPIFVKAISIGPTDIAFYRLFFAAILFALIVSFIGGPRALWPKLSQKAWVALVASAFFFALDLWVWHRSILYTGAGIATILANTSVFYLAFWGILFHKEVVTWRFWIAVPMAFLGVFLLVGYHVEVESPQDYYLGVVCGILAGLCYTGFLLNLRKVETLAPHLSSYQKMGWVCFVCSLLIVVGNFFEKAPILVPTHTLDYLYLIGLAGISQVMGWYLISNSLPKVPVSKTGLCLLFQPVIATILSAILFKEHLTLTQIAGAGLTLLSIYLGTLRNITS